MELYKIEIFSVHKKNPIRAEEYTNWESFINQAYKYNIEIDPLDYRFYSYNHRSNSWDTVEMETIQQQSNQE